MFTWVSAPALSIDAFRSVSENNETDAPKNGGVAQTRIKMYKGGC